MADWKEAIPLVAAYHQTKETWQAFDAKQKRAAILASVATFGRLGLRVAVERGQDTGKLSRTQAMLAHVVLDLTDTVDGKIARAGNAVTPWGKVADPLADKIDFAIQDIARVRRNEMTGTEASLRIGRDIASTALRHYESLHPAESTTARTAATWAGKSSTIGRSVANRIGDIAPQTPAATVARTTATAGLIASLASNWRDFRRNRSGK